MSAVGKLTDIARLIRLLNCCLAGVGVCVGAMMTWMIPQYYPILVASMAAFFVCAGGNVLNDIRDIETDRSSHPDRVLARGRLSTRLAWFIYALCNLIALVLGWSVNSPVLICVVIAIILLAWYSLFLKGIPVTGNMVIASLAGLTFMTGGVAIDTQLATILPGPIIPALFAFFFHLVREILKDVEDIEGDRRTNIRTLPQVIGVSASLGLCLGLFFILTILTYIPVLKGWFGLAYEVMVVYIVDLPLLALLIFIWGNPNRRLLRLGSVSLKVGMLIGMAALVIG